MRLFPRSKMILIGLAPLALAGAAAGPAAAATAATTAACSAWNGNQPVNPGSISSLYGLAVVSQCDVWTVGFFETTGDSPQAEPLIEHWTGGSWATVPGPSTTGFLYDVSATSASDIWAVGHSSGTLIAHYDGTSWVQKPSPHSDDGSFLNTVDARTATDAWAGGYTLAGSAENWLMLHWDGTSWTPASLPPAPSGDSDIIKVSADSATDVWALVEGSFNTISMLHWDGSQWTTSAVTGPPGATIDSITALSPTDAWAVGFSGTGGHQQTLTEHWDGTSWNVIPSPSPGGTGQNTVIQDVTATPGGEVWATGGYLTAPTTAAAFALHWNGSSWAAVTLPGSGIQSTDANTEVIRAAATGQAWVAGWGGFNIGQGSIPFAVPVPVVPAVTGQQANAAGSALTAAGLTSTQTQTTSCAPSNFGKVVSQNPAAGVQEPFGQAVTLTVCAALVTVPDVTGEDDASARSDITSAGLHVGTVTLKVNCTIPRGQVLSQSPAGGAHVTFGSSVNLTEATRSGSTAQKATPHFCTQ